MEDESNGAYTVRYTVPQDSVDDIFTIAVRMAVRATSPHPPAPRPCKDPCSSPPAAVL